MSHAAPIAYLSAPGFAGSGGERIAYKQVRGDGPTYIWCGGLKSDMEGGKAQALHRWASEGGRNFIRFDYFGHGVSSGEYTDGAVSRWARDIVQVIDDLSQGDVILIGSSMGGWASLLASLQRPGRVKGLLLIAPAPDFTETMWDGFSAAQQDTIIKDGVLYVPSDYDEPYAYTKVLIEDGRQNLLLDGPIAFIGPVRILQGAADDVVPWAHSMRLVEALASENVTYTLVKGGDHSLSNLADLGRLLATAEALGKTIR